IPIALGEQESSMRRFWWTIENNVAQVIQPDLHYYGGFVRSIRVARMAAEAGMPCTPHISNSGLGFLHAMHFVSCIPNPGDYHEYKGDPRLPVECDTSTLECKDGIVRCPSGPGFGVTIDPEFVAKAKPVEAI
ncbi:MAG: enolase C-terminal domain-like protein, partial [Armatimonadota bacterium]